MIVTIESILTRYIMKKPPKPQSVDGVREHFIRQVLSTGDWLPLKPTPTAFSSRVAGDVSCLDEGNEAKSPSGGDTKNPVS
jgi:hypothetical protein